mgnify:CR=1 FL=1
MPKVTINKSQGPEVRQAPVNAARVSADAPLEAFGGGAGLERQTEAARGTLENVQKIVILEKARAEQLDFQEKAMKLAEMNADLELETAETKGRDVIEYRPKNAPAAPDGAVSVPSAAVAGSGKAVQMPSPAIPSAEAATQEPVGLPDHIMSKWEKNANEILNSTKNENVKARLRKEIATRRIALKKYVGMHTLAETEAYDKENSFATIANARNEAILHYEETEKIEGSIIRQEEVYKGWAQRNGVSKEKIEEGIREIHTKTHQGVITQMLSDRNTTAAVEYYEDNKDFLPPAERLEIKKLIDAEKIEVDADAVASEIMAKSGPEIGDTEKYLNDIKDKDARDKVKEKLEPMIRQAREAQNAQQADIASRLADESYSLADFKKAESSLPVDFRNAVNFARREKAGNSKFKEVRDSTYLSLLETYTKISSLDPEDQTKAYMNLRKEILVSKPKLSEKTYKELLGLTNPKYILENKEKSGSLAAGISAIMASSFFSAPQAARAVQSYIEKFKTVSPEKNTEAVKSAIREESARSNGNAVKYEKGDVITIRGVTYVVKDVPADGDPELEIKK